MWSTLPKPLYNAVKPPIATKNDIEPIIHNLTHGIVFANDMAPLFAAACFASSVLTAPTDPVIVPNPIFPEVGDGPLLGTSLNF